MPRPFQPIGLPTLARAMAYHWIARSSEDGNRVKDHADRGVFEPQTHRCPGHDGHKDRENRQDPRFAVIPTDSNKCKR